MHHVLRDQQALGRQLRTTLWAEGHGDGSRSDAEDIEQREEQWTNARLA